MEGWVPLQNYPGYSASDQGRIRNDSRGNILAIVRTVSGHTFVGLMKDGVQVKRSVAKLIAEAFVEPPPHQPHFTTPIHLDGNLSNCAADNLMLRPRWFAMKFSQQFFKEQPNHEPIRRIKTGEEFEDCWPLVMTHGLLYIDIILSVVNNTYVFPIMEYFEWVIKSR